MQARHSSGCTLGRSWTPFDRASDGCTCPQGPLYYVVVRQGEHVHKEVVGRDRQLAELALLRVEDLIEEGEYQLRLNVGFSEWADRWLELLERKPSTVDSYGSTINHAKRFNGGSFVVGPRGELLHQMGEEPGVHVLEIPAGAVNEKYHSNPLGWMGWGFRRPDVYRPYLEA